jgi:hypothetical protein
MTPFGRLLVITAATALTVAGADARAGRGNDAPLPCGSPAAQTSGEHGLQVQLDPVTGTYSMPAPGTLETPQGRSVNAATAPVVVTPGTTAAGGFKVQLDGESLQQQGAK